MVIAENSLDYLDEHTIAVTVEVYFFAADHEDILLELGNKDHLLLLLVFAESLPSIADMLAAYKADRIR